MNRFGIVYALCGVATALARAMRYPDRPGGFKTMLVLVMLWPLYVIGFILAHVFGWLGVEVK